MRGRRTITPTRPGVSPASSAEANATTAPARPACAPSSLAPRALLACPCEQHPPCDTEAEGEAYLCIQFIFSGTHRTQVLTAHCGLGKRARPQASLRSVIRADSQSGCRAVHPGSEETPAGSPRGRGWPRASAIHLAAGSPPPPHSSARTAPGCRLPTHVA